MLFEYVIAKYIRLSVEDAKTDSLSIENQRLMLDRHIAEMDIPGATVLEFVDNGHSGTDFERPAVQKLLELVREGKVNCIIVKDLSRFGRNLIETGYYIERIFPLYRVRFISVSDAHDSTAYENDTGGMELAFKFLIHEQYSMDLSRKIKTAKRSKALRGEYIVKNCAFGFKKVGKRLEIDEPAADTVRLIFNLSASGHSLAEICARLYEEKRPTPSEYKNLSRQVLTKDIPCVWGKSVILDILSDEQYIGTYTAGKTRKLEVGSKKVVAVDESEWIKIPNHHPAIVSKALYDAARETIDRRGEPLRNRKIGTWHRYRDIKSPLQGKTVCGCCGHTLILSSTKNAAFHCNFTRAAPDAECYRLRMLACDLEKGVLRELRKQARDILNRTSDSPAPLGKPTEQAERIARIENAKRALYEQFVLGEIGKEEYITAKAGLDADFDKIKRDMAITANDSANKTSADNLIQLASDVIKTKLLSKQFVDAFVDTVRVYPDERVEITWNNAVFTSNIMEVYTYA